MSTPSEKSSRAATSPSARHDDIEDTASSSVQGTGAPPIVTVQEVNARAPPTSPLPVVPPVHPNTVFAKRTSSIRSRSVSPRPRRVVSPSLSVAQLRARTADQKADTAMSSVGRIADQVLHARTTADDAIAEARSVREQVESRIADVAKRTEIVASSVVGELTGRVDEAVRRSQADTSRAVGSVVQQLEQEIGVAASSATATSEQVAKMAVADVRSEFQAQIALTRAESQRRDAEARQQMATIAEGLSTLTDQLNRFKPASAAEVAGGQEQLSGAVDERLTLQSQRIDAVVESTHEAQKTAQDNAEILNTLLIGMENLSESVKKLREEMNAWGEPEGQEILNDLLKEVPIASEQPQVSNPSPIVSKPIPSVSTPALTVSMPPLTFGASVDELQAWLTAVRTSGPSKNESQEMNQGIDYAGPGAKVVNPRNTTMPYPGLDGHPRRITPIPLSLPLPPRENASPKPISVPSSKPGWYWSELSGGWFKTEELLQREQLEEERKKAAQEEADNTAESKDQSVGTNMSTIGNTSIPPTERERIRDEVRAVMRQNFPGIQLGTGHNSEPGNSGATAAQVTIGEQTSVPTAIAGSEVSVASTSNARGNALEFSRLSR